MAYVCEAVGVSPLSIEIGPIPEAGEVREVRMFQDDKEVEPGLPFMLLGPIGLRAWRANRIARTPRAMTACLPRTMPVGHDSAPGDH